VHCQRASAVSCRVELVFEARQELAPAGHFEFYRPLLPQPMLYQAVLALAESKGWSLAYSDPEWSSCIVVFAW